MISQKQKAIAKKNELIGFYRRMSDDQIKWWINNRFHTAPEIHRRAFNEVRRERGIDR